MLKKIAKLVVHALLCAALLYATFILFTQFHYGWILPAALIVLGAWKATDL